MRCSHWCAFHIFKCTFGCCQGVLPFSAVDDVRELFVPDEQTETAKTDAESLSSVNITKVHAIRSVSNCFQQNVLTFCFCCGVCFSWISSGCRCWQKDGQRHSRDL